MSFPGFDSTVLFFYLQSARPFFVRNLKSMLRNRRKGKNMYFDQVEFGKRVKRERIRLGFTQEALAERIGIGQIHMNAIERGRKGCSIDILLDLSEILEVSTDYLLSGRSPSNEKTIIQLRGVIDDLTGILQNIEQK